MTLPTEPDTTMAAGMAHMHPRALASAASAGLVPSPPWGIGPVEPGESAVLRGSRAAGSPICDGGGLVERLATPAEVDNGCELGIAYDPCPGCSACARTCGEVDPLSTAVA